MRGEFPADRVRLKAIMWELVILRLIRENGFQEILTDDKIRTRRKREQFFEMRGRGCWHQIDCPCEYDKFIAFINPVRLLGEVKYYSRPISKDHIRQFIGVLKDIQENYFTSDDENAPSARFTELGAFFSSSGFEKEAEKLAFAHNIKTISYKNVWILEPLKRALEDLENNYLSARECVSVGRQSEFVRAFKECLEGDYLPIKSIIRKFIHADGFDNALKNLSNNFRAICSSFVATTSGGAFLHFVGEQQFPESLFNNTDFQSTRVFYFKENSQRFFYLEFSEDPQRRKYYFNPPMALDQAAFYGPRQVIEQKRQIFKSIHITRQISGLSRNLVLELDQGWLEQVEARL